MADVQPEFGFVKLANQLQDQIILRDFTKLQLCILNLIIRLSYGCQRRTAKIPRKRDFEVAGITETVIERELVRLEKAGVVIRHRGGQIYELQKDYDKWMIGYVSAAHLTDPADKLAEMIRLNLTEPEDVRVKQGELFGKKRGKKLDKNSSKNLNKSQVGVSINMSKNNIKDNNLFTLVKYLEETLVDTGIHCNPRFDSQLQNIIDVFGAGAKSEAVKVIEWYRRKHGAVPGAAYVIQALINRAAEQKEKGSNEFKASEVNDADLDPFANR